MPPMFARLVLCQIVFQRSLGEMPGTSVLDVFQHLLKRARCGVPRRQMRVNSRLKLVLRTPNTESEALNPEA